MAGQQNARTYKPIRFGGVLNESKTAARVDGGLTACENLIYRRFGSWGKRAGSSLVFAAVPPKMAPQPAPSPAEPYSPSPPTPPSAPKPPPGTPNPPTNPKQRPIQ